MLLQMSCETYNLWYFVMIFIRQQDRKQVWPSITYLVVSCYAITMYVNLVFSLSLLSVSLEDLDPDEMSLVLNGALRSKRAREARRSVTQASLTSLTEEEVGAEHQEYHRSALEVRTRTQSFCELHYYVLYTFS